ncbi:MAG: hypothetical protein OXU94_10805 [Gammaproteobacteria bacterium]|nr:hypothetical protein [Gammaproteobacteria bacterium]
MRDIVIPDFVVYLVMLVAFVSVMALIFSNRIADWLFKRDQRKKAATKAAEAEVKSG